MTVPPLVRDRVNAFLGELDALAPGCVEGFYLTGSLALGDYLPRSSDIDFVAVTRNRAIPLPRRRGFDGRCLSFHDLAKGNADPVTLRMLALYGIACRGPEPASLDIRHDPATLARWTRNNLASYWRPLLEKAARFPNPWSLTAATGFGAAWIVLGLSRMHYTLATGDICSKEAAGAFGLGAFSQRWRRVIDESLRVRRADLASPTAAGALREFSTGRSLYRTPLERRRDVIAFGRSLTEI